MRTVQVIGAFVLVGAFWLLTWGLHQVRRAGRMDERWRQELPDWDRRRP